VCSTTHPTACPITTITPTEAATANSRLRIFFLHNEDDKCQFESTSVDFLMFFHCSEETGNTQNSSLGDWVFFFRSKESENHHNPLVGFSHLAMF
jgi:hypothetical protein